METTENFVTMLRRAFLTIMALPAIALAAQEQADSLSRALDEVTVEAARQYMTPEKSVYIPESKQKKASADAVALLARMSIPSLQVNPVSQAVKTVSGQDVQIFIDYLPATTDDITGMRMSDVRRVEVLDFPDDPRFHGAEHVVNFIMQKYEYGGYAKVYNQLFLTTKDQTERPRANAKFSYKRMTYDLVVGGDYSNGHDKTEQSVQTFRFPGLTPEETITRYQMPDGDGRLQYHTVYASLRGVYNTEKVQIANTVGFNYNKQPHFDEFSRTGFTGVDIPEVNTASLVNRLWRTLQWNGDYYFAMPHDFSMTVNPIFQHSYTERNARYMTGDVAAITNNAESKTTYGRLNLRLNRKLNDKITLWADLSGLYHRNSVDYFGSSPGRVVMDHWFFSPGLGMTLRLAKLYASLDAGYAMEWTDDGTTRDTPRYPYVHLSANYSFSQKLSAGLWMQFASNTPDAADRSPIMQQQNEFLWNCGNPLLTNSNHFNVNPWVQWMPSNTFQLSGYLNYFRMFNNSYQLYTPEIMPDGTPRMLMSLANGGNYNSLSVGAQATVKLFSNRLHLSGGPSFMYYSMNGDAPAPDISKAYASVFVQANYYLGSFNFTGYYMSPGRSVESSSGATTWSYPNYAIGAGWANNDWAVQLYVTQFAAPKDHFSSRKEFTSPYFSSVTSSSNGNNVATLYLTVSYTIGFGKKVQRGNELNAVSAGSDGILK